MERSFSETMEPENLPKKEEIFLQEWPTSLLNCCAGGISLCLWGFLCPICLWRQGDQYDLHPPWTPMSQLEEFPPWSCNGLNRYIFLCSWLICCVSCLLVGEQRHRVNRMQIEYSCYDHNCCDCCDCIHIEDCLIGYFCCCCSGIQVTMAREECFRLRSQVKGDVNIKHAQA